jgi:hypothetical protein
MFFSAFALIILATPDALTQHFSLAEPAEELAKPATKLLVWIPCEHFARIYWKF